MNLYLGVAILLFVILTFVPKEGFTDSENKGYYSDTNVTSAVDGLTTLNTKLATLKTTIGGFTTADYSAMDAVSSISKVLTTKDNALYVGGVIDSVKEIKQEMDEFQTDVLALNELIILLTKVEGLQLYDSKEKRKIPYTLPKGIDKLIERSNELSSKLNKIPAA
jgi:hypothetical protein